MLFPKGKLIIFSKAPDPGLVKTRLIPELGDHGAAELHRTMLDQKIRLATDSRIAPVDLYCSPDKNHPYFQQLQSRFPIDLHNQVGSDLGERMATAINEALQSCKHAVIIGTDCPPLDHIYLTEAFELLSQGKEAVIGPASDGGYVLIGANITNRGMFEDIVWGQSEVYSQTISRFNGLGIEYAVLNTLWDVDTPEDLIRYRDYQKI